MADKKTYFCGSLIAGIVLAILFGILAGIDEGNRPAYIGAAVVCGVAAIVGLIGCLKS